MNRGRSSDSLDNGDGDLKCSSSGSSSPTYFTSDDELSEEDRLYKIMNRQLMKSRILASSNIGQPTKSNKLPEQYYHGVGPLSSRHNMLQSHARPILGAGTGSNQHMYANRGAGSKYHTSFYDDTPPLSSNRLDTSVNSHSSRIPDVVVNHDEIIAGSMHRFSSKNHAPNMNINDENGEKYCTLPDVDVADLFERKITSPVTSLPGPSRGMNNIATRMCSRLVECRSLNEAIDFVEQNRAYIEELTSIVTRDAPAFRNYEISNYQIDYSVKESFNPNFWLDREPIVTTADGNCQYHAVSLSLTGSEAYTPEVRLATAVAVIDNREWFDSTLKLIDRGTVLDLVHTIARSYSWGDETTLKAIAVAINKRIFLYACNIGKKDYEMVKSLSKEELLDAFKEKKYRGGTGIHTYADPLNHVPANNYIMLFHKSEHFIAVLPTSQHLTMFEPYNPIVPVFS